MPLSEYEQRVLEQMERALTSDDPRLANTLQSPKRHPLLRYVLAGVAVVGGLLLLVLGVAIKGAWALGVVGFILMFSGVAFAFSSPRSRRRAAKAAGPAADGTAKAAAPAPRKGFLSRLEERWDRRREQGGR